MEFLSYQPLYWLAILILLMVGYWSSLVDRPIWRHRAAFCFRVLGVLLLIFALCRPSWVGSSEHVHVAYVVDVSESIEPESLREVRAEIEAAQSQLKTEDSHAVYLLGKRVQPVDLDEMDASIDAIESGAGDADFRSQTRIAAGLLGVRLDFPADRARRIILFTDGVDNGGNLSSALETLEEEGVEVFIRPLDPLQEPEASVIAVEPATKQAFSGEVVRLDVTLRANQSMGGQLRILHRGVVVAEQAVDLLAKEPVKVSIDVEMVTSGATQWTAELIPDADHFPMNNRMDTTIDVKGRPRVLVIHQQDRKMRNFARAMKTQGIDLDLRGARGLPDSLEAMLAFDAIILADVPATDLRTAQMNYLKRYVAEFGGGLAMFGSENSFGLGGYYRTPVEAVLPLNSRFEKEKQKPSLAMLLVIDKSGSMSGTPIALARQAAQSAAELLGARDQIAVLGFDSQAVVICEMTSAASRGLISNAINSLSAGGGTNLYPAMLLGRDMLDTVSAQTKHMIILSDGQTSGGDFMALAQEMADRGVTISTVALGSGAARDLMQTIARTGAGRYYETNDPNTVPQIFTKETMEASKSAIKEDLYGSVAVTDHPMLSGYLQSELPITLGYVMTRANPTAQVLLAAETGDPLLAVARYRLGHGLAYTSDLTEQWGSEWLAWSEGPKFWAQVLRGILKKENGLGLSVQSAVNHDQLEISVLRQDDALRPLNGLNWSADGIDSSGEIHQIGFEQTGLGRYAGRLDVTGLERIAVRVTDTDYNRSQVVRWQRPYPAEYLLGVTISEVLSPLPEFTANSVREGIQPVKVSRSAVPWFGLLGMFSVLIGIVLRRI